MWWHLDDSYNMKTDEKKYQPSLPAKVMYGQQKTQSSWLNQTLFVL